MKGLRALAAFHRADLRDPPVTSSCWHNPHHDDIRGVPPCKNCAKFLTKNGMQAVPPPDPGDVVSRVPYDPGCCAEYEAAANLASTSAFAETMRLLTDRDVSDYERTLNFEKENGDTKRVQYVIEKAKEYVDA